MGPCPDPPHETTHQQLLPRLLLQPQSVHAAPHVRRNDRCMREQCQRPKHQECDDGELLLRHEVGGEGEQQEPEECCDAIGGEEESAGACAAGDCIPEVEDTCAEVTRRSRFVCLPRGAASSNGSRQQNLTET